MAAPRARYGEYGEGRVEALTPRPEDLRAVKAGEGSARAPCVSTRLRCTLPTMTPCQQLRALVDLLPGTRAELAAALGVREHALHLWLLRARYEDEGRAWTRREAPPSVEVLARALALVAAHGERCARAASLS